MQSHLKILFLDDHAGLRDGLGSFLMNKNPSLEFYYAENKETAVDILRKNPDITNSIIDININGLNGLDFISSFREVTPNLNVIVYSMFNDYLHIEQALQKNIQGYLAKDASLDEVEKAITLIAEGSFYFNKTTRELMNNIFKSTDEKVHTNSNIYTTTFDDYKSLSAKEKKLFELLAQQKEVPEIAHILGKAEKTINNQISIIYQKFNIHNRLELIKIAKILGVTI